MSRSVRLIDLLMVPLDRADLETRSQLLRFELPTLTQIGYIGRIKPLPGKGESVVPARPVYERPPDV